MSQLSNKSVGAGKTDEPTTSREVAAAPSAGRVFLLGSVLIVVVVAVLLLAIRTFLFPVWEANSEGARQVATAEAQLSVARTQEALAPRLTATVVAPSAVNSTVVPAQTSVVAPAPAARPTLEPPTAVPIAAVIPGPTTIILDSLPTPTADQAAEVAAAYKRYFDVRSEALLNLDPDPLSDVAAGESLAGLQQSIEQDRAAGRAVDTNVEHDVYVLDIQGDQADVADRYKDSSIYVDPVSHAPLPGQVAPATPDVAPAVSVVYHLQRIDGTWKVVSGQRYVPREGQ